MNDMENIVLQVSSACDMSKSHHVYLRLTNQIIPFTCVCPPKDLFGVLRVQVAQLLLSQADFAQKEHWSNVTLGPTSFILRQSRPKVGK